MPKYNMNYLPIGEALSGYASSQAQGYKDMVDMQQKQQHLDFLYPQELTLPSSFPQQLSVDPSQVLANTYTSALNARPQQQLVQPATYNDNNNRYQTAPAPTVSPIKSPSAQAYDNQTGRTPSGEGDSGPSPEEQLQQIQTSKKALADSLGIKFDPQTGAMKASGAQAHFYMEYLKPLLAHEASIWASVGRPPQPVVVPNSVIPDRRAGGTGGPHKTPLEESLLAEKNKIQAALHSPTASLLMTPDQLAKMQARSDEIDGILGGGSQRFINPKGQSMNVAPAINNAPSVSPDKSKTMSSADVSKGIQSGSIKKQTNKSGQIRYVDTKTGAVIDVK